MAKKMDATEMTKAKSRKGPEFREIEQMAQAPMRDPEAEQRTALNRTGDPDRLARTNIDPKRPPKAEGV